MSENQLRFGGGRVMVCMITPLGLVPSPLRERVRVRGNVRADALTPALSHVQSGDIVNTCSGTW
ncbi:hypothetical protein TUM17577_44240 [Enterobacter asburiae]|nr:hypothetical protein TUM17577_44240 [Enterobacter asburiae]